MHPDKSQGPDGFNPAFYQRFWEQCGDDIFVAASNWLDRGYFPTSLNETNICLIPKCDNPISMKDLRPISLCNVLYKMISKVLANRLKDCLDRCVSQEQSAFVEGRSILDNALIAIEVIHALKRKTKGRRGELALKIDISKAHDKVDWGFLRGVLTSMGFGDSWIRWIMMCVSSVNYSVPMNYNKVGPIIPGRGLRQGDPLSPYLFIMVTEGLTSLIHQAGKCRRGTSIYLGLPSMIGRSKKAIFSYIKDRIWKKMNSWRGRALSKAGKEVMIKSVLQAIPSYVMSMFILPSSLIDDIEKMLNAFWWGGGSNNNKGIHWLAWDRLACPKANGGLGFRNFEAFNMAIVAKQAWNIIQNPESLVAKIIKARYFPRSSLLEASLVYNPSFAWRSIWKARQILLHGCRWRIGSGDRIRVMYDPWLRGNDDRWVSSPQVECVYDLFVKDLLLENYKTCDIAKIRNLFIGPVVKEIIATPLISSVKEDKVVWEEERNRCYSVKSGYNLAIRCIFRSNKYHVEEDDIHVFFGCVATRECWMTADLSQLLENPSYQDGIVEERVFEMCRNEDNAMIGRVASLFWCIWHNRNDKIWNDNIQLPSQVGRMAFAVWNEWFTVHQLRRQNIVPVENPRPVRWEKPGVRWIKCNVDVAFVTGSGITSRVFVFATPMGDV
ncbi:hypothetical protein TSUD_402180 [Trifolium subterraneum]|uniref:Reverse transcriptase domain-containing protein n=1 Tax=Trifolium subterraneum TaxID=3900 RepID=A0A2Z6NQW1_TRISU|nr:hypothetical protein TSUD_402180 [Trifolium subterraneum]